MSQSPDNLIWIDLEMTGLEPLTDRIIEIATIITDANLNILEEGPVFAIHQADEVLAQMDEWNTSHHGASGLTDRVKASRVDEKEAAQKTIDFVSDYVSSSTSPMCGNSICQDRRFLAQHMPELEAYFHYRNLDVSTLKELGKRWRPDIWKNLPSRAHILRWMIFVSRLRNYVSIVSIFCASASWVRDDVL